MERSIIVNTVSDRESELVVQGSVLSCIKRCDGEYALLGREVDLELNIVDRGHKFGWVLNCNSQVKVVVESEGDLVIEFIEFESEVCEFFVE